MPLNEPTSTDLLGRPLDILDARAFLAKKELVFDREIYRFVADGSSPRILDCGSGIGLAICYFKKLYPESKITAFEPDPRVFDVCRRNCDSWGAKDVELLPLAVSDRERTAPLTWDFNLPARLRDPAPGEESVQVRTCRLRDYLRYPVDLLRLNIEGEEVGVLQDCADVLSRVRNLIVHYHSIADRPQRLEELTALLSSAGFRIHVISQLESPTPLVFRPLPNGMDSKLRIFGFRL